MNSHQIVDLAVLAVLLYCAVRGASRGLLSQLAWVVALVLCFRFSGALAPAIEPMIGVDDPGARRWIAMLAVYVGLCGLSFVAAGMLSSWMEKIRLRDFDRHLGGVLGLLKGVLICMTIMYFAITKSEPMRQIVSRTYSGYAAAHVLDKSRFLIAWVPEEHVADVQEVIDRFRQRLRQGPDDLQGATPTGPGWTSVPAAGDSDDGFNLEDLIRDQRSDPAGDDLTGRGTANEPTLTEILEQLPAELRDQLSRKAIDTLRRTTADQKQRLLDSLSKSSDEAADSVLTSFFRELAAAGSSGEPGDPQEPSSRRSAPSSLPTELGRAESQMLNEIAAIYGGRYDVVPRAKKNLAGLPASVQRQVLADWHADTVGHASDPDPATDLDTRLDERILRQLQKQGVSLDRLDRELRNRLTLDAP